LFQNFDWLFMKKLTLIIVCAMAVSGAAFGQSYIQTTLPNTAATFQTNTEIPPPIGGPFEGGAIVGETVTAWIVGSILLTPQSNWSAEGGSISINWGGIYMCGEATLSAGNSMCNIPLNTAIAVLAPGCVITAGEFSPDVQLSQQPIPEPATVALVGLGGFSLLLFRRRK